MDAESKPKICGTCQFWSPNRLKEPDPLARKWCLNPEVDAWTEDEHTCHRHLGADATEVNVPNHLRNPTMTDPNPNPLDGPTEVLVISYSKDFPWLVYALKCATKFLHGFQGITVAHPQHESALFEPLRHQFDIRLHAYDEPAGKGMLMHQVKMAEADLFLPASTKYFLTLDSDCMFHTHSRPEHFAWNDKPYWIVRTWESLIKEDPKNPGSRSISDCYQWLPVTQAQLGFYPALYTMCVNSQLMPLSMLAPYRAHLESVHHKPFRQYMLEGENSFPQSRTDFNALGAYAHRFHKDKFHWFDIDAGPFPEDRKRAYHSHSGLREELRMEIEGFLSR